MPFLTCL